MTAQAKSVAADACPARDKLAAYSLGALCTDDIIRLATHLEHCTTCLDTLNRLDDYSDSLVTSLAKIRPVPSRSSVDEDRILQNLTRIAGTRAKKALAPPRQVGPYEILEPLAEGGMGAVYKARHIHLGKIVALKLLSAERVSDGLSVQRFMQEMRALGQLSHPNIVQAHDAGVETVPFLAMEFLEGMDLARLIKERGPMSTAQACECVRQTALALQHASTCGLVHRDIKPSNLLLTPEGCIKLLDLGLARFGADLPSGPDAPGNDDTITSVGAVVGTIDYIAPEQLVDSRAVDSRADLYSLGCTLYYLLTGVPPFGRAWEGNNAKRQAHLNEPSPNIRFARPGVPDGLAVILERLLAKNPDFRFVTPAEVAVALQTHAAGCTLRGMTDARVPDHNRAAQDLSVLKATPAPQSRAFAWTLLTFAFLLGAALGVAFLATRPANDNPREIQKKALTVEAFEMSHFRTDAKEVRLLGAVGANDAIPRDSFRITARLAEPAHLHLIAYMPDGKAILCTPEHDISGPTRTLTFPREGLMSLDEPGMHGFVLLASRTPLPPYERWHTGPIAWPKNANPAAGAWKFDGQKITELAPGSSPAPPGFKELYSLFTARPGIDAVQAIAIAVQPSQSPAKIDGKAKE